MYFAINRFTSKYHRTLLNMGYLFHSVSIYAVSILLRIHCTLLLFIMNDRIFLQSDIILKLFQCPRIQFFKININNLTFSITNTYFFLRSPTIFSISILIMPISINKIRSIFSEIILSPLLSLLSLFPLFPTISHNLNNSP